MNLTIVIPLLTAASMIVGVLTAVPAGVDPLGLCAGVLGGAVAVTIFPLIWWGIRKFRAEYANGPIILWIVLVVIMGWSTWTVADYEFVNRGTSHQQTN